MYHPILKKAPTTINAGGVPIEVNQIASIEVTPDGGTKFSLRKAPDAIGGFELGPDASPRATGQLKELGQFFGGLEQLGLAHNAAAMHAETLGHAAEAKASSDLAGALLQASTAQEAQGMTHEAPNSHGQAVQHAPHAAHMPQHTTHMAHSPSGASWMNRVESRDGPNLGQTPGGPAL